MTSERLMCVREREVESRFFFFFLRPSGSSVSLFEWNGGGYNGGDGGGHAQSMRKKSATWKKSSNLQKWFSWALWGDGDKIQTM